MPIPLDQLRRRAREVAGVVLDVDGVLTDAALYYGSRGESLKRFSARDGFAIKLAQSEGISVAVLSGRLAPPLRARLNDLGIPAELVIQGSREKGKDFRKLSERMAIAPDRLAFMGDDLPDLPALALAGLASCPADAAPDVRARCHHVCAAPGGAGAVRDLVELILRARGRWEDIVESWVTGAARLVLDARAERGER